MQEREKYMALLETLQPKKRDEKEIKSRDCDSGMVKAFAKEMKGYLKFKEPVSEEEVKERLEDIADIMEEIPEEDDFTHFIDFYRGEEAKWRAKLSGHIKKQKKQLTDEEISSKRAVI